MPTALAGPELALIALLGACIGSFISLISHRLPLDEPVVRTRSRCPHCLHVLSVRDLLPIFSWVLARGRCRYCSVRVSMRYPLIELSCALGASLLVWWFGLSLATAALVGMWWAAVALIATDLEHYIILDEVQIALALLALLYHYARGGDMVACAQAGAVGIAIGCILKYGFLWATHKDGLGLGDVKFLGVAGLWLASSASFVPFLFISGVLGIASAALWRLLGRGEVFPFGPALMLSLVLCTYYPYAATGFWSLYGFLQHSAFSTE